MPRPDPLLPSGPCCAVAHGAEHARLLDHYQNVVECWAVKDLNPTKALRVIQRLNFELELIVASARFPDGRPIL